MVAANQNNPGQNVVFANGVNRTETCHTCQNYFFLGGYLETWQVKSMLPTRSLSPRHGVGLPSVFPIVWSGSLGVDPWKCTEVHLAVPVMELCGIASTLAALASVAKMDLMVRRNPELFLEMIESFFLWSSLCSLFPYF